MASGNFNHRVNGCEPRGMVRENRSPRGSIVRRQGFASIADEFGNSHEMKRSKLLVRIKSGSRRQFSIFYSFCKQHNIEFREPRTPIPTTERWIDSETGEYVYDEQPRSREYSTVYEVTGANCFLAQLALLPCIVSYRDGIETALNIGSPHFHSGAAFTRSVSIKHTQSELFSDCPNVFYQGRNAD